MGVRGSAYPCARARNTERPAKVSRAWVFRDTRLPVATVIEKLEDLNVEEVMEQFEVAREQIAAVLDFCTLEPMGFRAEQPSAHTS